MYDFWRQQSSYNDREDLENAMQLQEMGTAEVNSLLRYGGHELAGSGNVFCNGISVSRQGDKNTVHLKPANLCPPDSASSSGSGSSTVKVNGKGCGRVGDGPGACTSVCSRGSANVHLRGLMEHYRILGRTYFHIYLNDKCLFKNLDQEESSIYMG